jgi:hypothetical protein
LTAGIRKQGRVTTEKNSVTCKCGSETHARTTYKQCPMNKKRKISSIDDMETEAKRKEMEATASAMLSMPSHGEGVTFAGENK